MSRNHKSALSSEQRARYKAHWDALTPQQRAAAKALASKHKKIVRMGRKLLDAYGLKGWDLTIVMDDEPGFFDVSKDGWRLHGRCSHSDRRITLHCDLLDSPRDAKQTILHEIAHVLVRRRYGKKGDDGHGPKFCKLAGRLGCRSWVSVEQYTWANMLKECPEMLDDPMLVKPVRGLLEREKRVSGDEQRRKSTRYGTQLAKRKPKQ